MDVNWNTVATGAEGFLTLLDEMAPLAGLAGPQGAAIGTVIAEGAKIAGAVVVAAQNAGEAVSASDLASLEASNASIQALNDAASEQVAAS